MKIEKIDINLLKLAKYNPRKDLQPEDNEYKKIKRSIEEFGYVDPLIVNKDLTVIGGNQRLKVLKELGYKKVDCVLVDLDKTKEKALNITLNKIEGEWDLPKLKDLLQELDTGELDMDITGFDYSDLEELMTQFYMPDEKDDEIPDISEEPISKLGDLYKLGEHRLLCGDATKIEDIKRLMNGKKADIVFTDPPYNIGYDYWDYLGDEKTGEYKNWCKKWFSSLMKLSPIILIIIGQWNLKMWFDIAKPLGIINWIARNKTSGSKISLFSVWEPILVYAKKIKKKRRNKADYVEGMIIRDEDEFIADVNDAIECVKQNCDLIEINNIRQKNVGSHKCPKQVNLLTELLLRYSDLNNLVLDIFGGSGTTLIACEKLKRKCYMMEIDPKYVDVIIKRYENYTGNKIKLIEN